DACIRTLRQEHFEDSASTAVAKKLAELLFVVGNGVALDHRNEVLGSEAGEGGTGKVRVGGDEVFRCGVEVGEVTAAAAGDEYLLAGRVAALEDEDAATARAGHEGAHEAGCAGAEDDDVVGGHVSLGFLRTSRRGGGRGGSNRPRGGGR